MVSLPCSAGEPITMSDEAKTDEQLLNELAVLRRRVAELEQLTMLTHFEGDWAKESNLLRTLIDNLPDSFVFIKDTDSRFVTTNATHLQILGAKTLEEVVGKTDFEFFPQELAEQYYADEQNIIKTGQALFDREELVIDQFGNKTWVFTSKVPLRNYQGKIVGLVGVSRDITELKQVRETVTVSHDKLQRLIHQLPIAIQIFDTHLLCLHSRRHLHPHRDLDPWSSVGAASVPI